MLVVEYIVAFLFWLSIGFIVYTYVLYPIILLVWYRLFHNKPALSNDYMPTVSLLIAAHNEENTIEEKIQNVLAIHYPADKIEVLIGLDGCTDTTSEILKKYTYSHINVIEFNERRGKSAVINDLAGRAENEILVFSDANTTYDQETVRKLVRHFKKTEIGGVCGKLKLIPYNRNVSSLGESVYWQYENMLKLMEGSIKTTIGATGAIYAIRRSLYKNLPVDQIVMDDFLIPLAVVSQGYRVIFDTDAVGYERTTASMDHEFSRKVRIGIANFVGLNEIRSLLSPRWKFVAFALWSHKVIRWLVPLFMISILLSNICLLLLTESPLYLAAFGLQALFYGLAGIGYVLDRYNLSLGVLGYPYFFVSMHFALLIGLIKFMQNKRQPMWRVFR
jgi:poly-beta-1,6-N-acetyl-D-glucosamine synthase